MRVIAGRAKGHKLLLKDSLAVRPTSDKVKGAVFNMLAPFIPGCSFLDLFAGSGAMGIEAWSRGAARVVFVEKDRRVYAQLRANLERVGFLQAECLQADYQAALHRLQGESFDVIFIDPPYLAGYYQPALDLIEKLQLLTQGGWLCLEHPRSWQLPDNHHFVTHQHKYYGDTAITILRRQ
jgi:16S rRNA (guanine966-N2)-methyltransferase